MLTWDGLMSFHGLKCAESCNPCVARMRTHGGSKFFHELKCKSSCGGKRGTELYTLPQDAMGGFCHSQWVCGVKTIIGRVAKVKVDHARVQDGSPVDDLSSTRLVL